MPAESAGAKSGSSNLGILRLRHEARRRSQRSRRDGEEGCPRLRERLGVMCNMPVVTLPGPAPALMKTAKAITPPLGPRRGALLLYMLCTWCLLECFPSASLVLTSAGDMTILGASSITPTLCFLARTSEHSSETRTFQMW